MVPRPLLTLLAGLSLLLPLTFQAQVTPYGFWQSDLTNEDFRAIDGAARELAARGNAPDGASKQWQNKRTGASGSVTVVNSFHSKGMLCPQGELHGPG